MSATKLERLERLLATARTNPEFASQMLARLPEELQQAVIDALTVAPKEPKPGPHKCKAPARDVPTYGEHSGYTAQLNLFARSTSRVA
jgi:hypothetical protein